jgi:hypothetical protein
MSIPLVLLGGRGAGKRRDPTLEKPTDYNEGGLGGKYKLVEVEIGGKPLGAWVLDAYAAPVDASGEPVFDPIYIAGPQSLLTPFLSTETGRPVNRSMILPIDTDGHLSDNIAAIGRKLLRSEPHTLTLLAPGDILPAAADLEGLVSLLQHHKHSADIVYPIVSAEAMRTIGFGKRVYQGFDREGQQVPYVFGQVYGVRPSQLRWDFIAAGARVTYARRAKGWAQQLGKPVIYGAALSLMLKPRNFASAFAIPQALEYKRRVKEGTLSFDEAETAVRRIALYRDPGRHGVRRVVIELTPWASLAADIDTETEKTATEYRLLGREKAS